MTNRRAVIRGTGLYAPERVVKNEEFNRMYGKDVATFLVEKRGIHERRYMNADQATSDLIQPAAEMALRNAGVSASDLDLIIVSTDTPDYLSPSTASVVQYRLGAENAGCFDVNSACSGFVTALDMASKYIAADAQYRNILVVGAYAMTKWIDFDDYKIATLFADGAGAVVVQASESETGILAGTLFADGQYHDYMGVYGGGSRRPITHEVLENRRHLLDFAKKIPIETNGTHWPRLTNILLDRLHKPATAIDHFFLTQINIQSIHEALDNLGLPHSKSHNIMDRYGYTGSACLPMALHDAVTQHKLKKGDLVFMLGSGGGLSMAAVALEWAYDT
ncbi:MAG TPA: ketoacyl-ACP synthase III [Bdellovibrionales bacterium]|nr:ketoacyl-ACP synthase III [Bdellovibrionales bacterium]